MMTPPRRSPRTRKVPDAPKKKPRVPIQGDEKHVKNTLKKEERSPPIQSPTVPEHVVENRAALFHHTLFSADRMLSGVHRQLMLREDDELTNKVALAKSAVHSILEQYEYARRLDEVHSNRRKFLSEIRMAALDRVSARLALKMTECSAYIHMCEIQDDMIKLFIDRERRKKRRCCIPVKE